MAERAWSFHSLAGAWSFKFIKVIDRSSNEQERFLDFNLFKVETEIYHVYSQLPHHKHNTIFRVGHFSVVDLDLSRPRTK